MLFALPFLAFIGHIFCLGLILLFSFLPIEQYNLLEKTNVPKGSVKISNIFKNSEINSANKKLNSPLHASAHTVNVPHVFFCLIMLPLLSHSAFSSAILLFPNDCNNEALSSASTTDAQNILLLLLLLHLLFLCLTHSDSYQNSHSSTDWTLITSNKYLSQSVGSDFQSFSKSK